MRRSGWLTITLGLSLCACATGGTGPDSQAIAPAGGCPPFASASPGKAGKQASQDLDQGNTQQARKQLEALGPAPFDKVVAGRIYAATGEYAAADKAFAQAEKVCPAWQTDLRAERDKAWGTVFQHGIDAYQKADYPTARTAWTGAALLAPYRPDAQFNLAVMDTEQQAYEQAGREYLTALEALEHLPATTVDAERKQRADTRHNIVIGLLKVGAEEFKAQQLEPSAAVFQRLTSLEPRNRDAWYNYSLVLYKMQKWTELIPVSKKVVELDPLNQNARVVLYNGYKGLNDVQPALATLHELDALPVYVDGVKLVPGPGRSVLQANVVGNTATVGTPIRLKVTLGAADADLGSAVVTVAAPARGASAPIEAVLENPTSAETWRYEPAP